MEQVVLVDPDDNKVGLMDKLEAHKHVGRLHRAISILLYRRKNGNAEVLIQRRSGEKPLWPLFWSNTVCTHPRDQEGYLDCASRRLQEELGILLPASQLRKLYRFEYQADFDEIFSEHELDTVIVGEYSGPVSPNFEEVADIKWVGWSELGGDVTRQPERYTPWFLMMLGWNDIKRLFEEEDGGFC